MFKRINIYDYIIIGAALFLALVSGAFFYLYSPTEAEKARLSINGEFAREIPLGEDGEYNLDFMVLEVSGGRIRVSGADCPRKICVETGWISSSGQSIVCLPNKTVISLPPEGNKKYDAVTY